MDRDVGLRNLALEDVEDLVDVADVIIDGSSLCSGSCSFCLGSGLCSLLEAGSNNGNADLILEIIAGSSTEDDIGINFILS